MKRVMFCVIALLMAAMTTMSVAFAQTVINVGNPGTSGNGYSVENGVITIASNGEYTLQGSTASNRVVVAAGVTATVTLQNVSIASTTGSPLEVGGGAAANVTLHLAGTNTLNCTAPESDNVVRYYAALQVEGTSSVTITGSGSLTVNGGEGGAGIGSGSVEDIEGDTSLSAGTIIIKSGNITATGGDAAAGIGAGYNAAGRSVTIEGGHILAVGGNYAAGIGCGYMGSSPGNIRISGGSIFAVSGAQASGIGVGTDGPGNVGSINITGGTIVTEAIGMNGTPISVTGGAIIVRDAINNVNADGNVAVIVDPTLIEANIRTFAANAPKESSDTVRVEVPGPTVHDTVHVQLPPDTVVQIVRDTVVRTVYDTIVRTVYDTLHITVHDTIIEKQIVHDTLVETQYDTIETVIVLDYEAGVEVIVEEELPVVDMGNDMYFLRGVEGNKAFAVFDSTGALIYRGTANPVRITGYGLFIVVQGERYWKFVR